MNYVDDASMVMVLIRMLLFSSQAPVDLPISDRKFEAIGSAGVTLSTSQPLLVCSLIVQTFCAVWYYPEKVDLTAKLILVW